MKIVNGVGQATHGTLYQGRWVIFLGMEIFQSVYDCFLKHVLSHSILTVRSEIGVSMMKILRTEY